MEPQNIAKVKVTIGKRENINNKGATVSKSYNVVEWNYFQDVFNLKMLLTVKLTQTLCMHYNLSKYLGPIELFCTKVGITLHLLPLPSHDLAKSYILYDTICVQLPVPGL